jgi:hypothetical protein
VDIAKFQENEFCFVIERLDLTIMDKESEALRYFVGRIPPFLRFEMEYHSLFYLVESHKDDPFYKDANPATEIAWIGFVAHFEAFCKHQFAAILNIAPSIISQFATQREEATMRLSDVAIVLGGTNVGFVLAEQYDFGSPKMINGLFRDLLGITVFSKNESERFDAILIKRHLLVHHAGAYTLRYAKVHAKQSVLAYNETVKVTTEDFCEMSEFLFEMAMKIARISTTSLKMFLKDTGDIPDLSHPLQLLVKAVYDDLA